MLISALKSNTLLVATTLDPASLNIATSLINRNYVWRELQAGKIWFSQNSVTSSNVFLWLQDKPLLHLNYVDQMFKQEAQLLHQQVDDVVFLSKHAAASGIPSLTVHPIGIPWTTDVIRNGGLPGRCSPPSFRISSLYRALVAKMNKLTEKTTDYQVK
jgi:D-aminoacyl-tRNA deacylase